MVSWEERSCPGRTSRGSVLDLKQNKNMDKLRFYWEWDWDLIADARLSIRLFLVLNLLTSTLNYKSNNAVKQHFKEFNSLAAVSFVHRVVKEKRTQRVKSPLMKSTERF